MCNRARLSYKPETLRTRFGADWLMAIPNTTTVELAPGRRAPIIRREAGRRVIDAMDWDLLGGAASYPLTNVRDLKRWRARQEQPDGRFLVPLS